MNGSHRSRRTTVVLALLPIAVAAVVLIYSFSLTGRFTPNPQLQARLQGVTLTKERHYGPAYRIASSEFICAGSASWSAGGVRDGWTTNKATFRVFLADSSGAHTREGPVYLEVTDVFGLELVVKSVNMSSWQLTWLNIQRGISSGVFRALNVVFIVGYMVFLALWRTRRNGTLPGGTATVPTNTIGQKSSEEGAIEGRRRKVRRTALAGCGVVVLIIAGAFVTRTFRDDSRREARPAVEAQICECLLSGSSSYGVVKLCDQDVKGKSVLDYGQLRRPGVVNFGPGDQISVLCHPQEAYLWCKEGASVEYADGSVLVVKMYRKTYHWVDKKTGKDRGVVKLWTIFRQ